MEAFDVLEPAFEPQSPKDKRPIGNLRENTTDRQKETRQKETRFKNVLGLIKNVLGRIKNVPGLIQYKSIYIHI